MCLQNNVLFWLSANIFLSSTIVFLNKLVYLKTNCPVVTLTFLHFVITFLGLLLWEKLNLFQVKRLPFFSILPLSLSFCGFVVFTNLSLGYNTIGTYQILKTLTMPTIMLIQYFMYHRTFSLKIKLTLVPITVGAILNSAYDIKFNTLGIIFACIGVVITSFYQVWVGEKQSELQANCLQLLHRQVPLSALLLLLLICLEAAAWPPSAPTPPFQWGVTDMALVLISGVVAFLVNVSIYWIIGNTSAVTYNVVGQMKFCITLSGGYLLFMEPILPIQFFGILITLSGIFMYAYFKTKDERSKLLPSTIKLTEELLDNKVQCK